MFKSGCPYLKEQHRLVEEECRGDGCTGNQPCFSPEAGLTIAEAEAKCNAGECDQDLAPGKRCAGYGADTPSLALRVGCGAKRGPISEGGGQGMAERGGGR